MDAQTIHSAINSLDKTCEQLNDLLRQIDTDGVYSSTGGRRPKKFLAMEEARSALVEAGVRKWSDFQVRKRRGEFPLIPSNPPLVWGYEFPGWKKFFAMKV